MTYRVPFNDLAGLTGDVRAVVAESWAHILDGGRFVGGDAVEEFEEAWARYCGTSQAIGVGNGTDALRLTLSGLGLGPGDEVVVPANTFVASAEAVLQTGATPLFADVSSQTLLLSPDTLSAVMTPRTRAVIVVHLYGQMADVDALSQITERTGIALIEDAAQAHGATWRGKPAGSAGQAGCFSFYPAKNLGAFGDAGAVVTSDEQLARRIRSLRDHGRVESSRYHHDLVGTNSRLDSLQAAVLTAKLARLDDWNGARRLIAGRYRDALAGGPARLVEEAEGARGVFHLAVARVAARDDVQRGLAARGIETAIHYPIPCHRHPPYARFARMPLPVAEQSSGEILSLPMFPHMTEGQTSMVCEALHHVVSAAKAHVA